MPRVRLISGGWESKRLSEFARRGQQMLAGMGVTADVDCRGASGQLSELERLMTDAKELDGIDVIVTLDTRAHRFIPDRNSHPQPGRPPIVAIAMTGSGTILTRPHGNRMTGVIEPDLAWLVDQQLNILGQLAPNVTTIHILHYTNQGHNATAVPEKYRIVQKVITDKGLRVGREIRMDSEVDLGWQQAIDQLDKKFDTLPVDSDYEIHGLLVLPSAMVSFYRRAIMRNVNIRKMPAAYPYEQFAVEGGLLSFDRPKPLEEVFARVKAILDGKAFTDPELQPAPVAENLFKAAVNVTTAKELGVDDRILPNMTKYERGPDADWFLARSTVQA